MTFDLVASVHLNYLSWRVYFTYGYTQVRRGEQSSWRVVARDSRVDRTTLGMEYGE